MNHLLLKTNRHLVKPARSLLFILLILAVTILLLETIKLVGFPLPQIVWQAWLVILLVVCLIALVDTLLVNRITSPTLTRSLPGHLLLNRWQEVSLLIENQHDTTLTLILYDHCPSSIKFAQLPQTINLPAASQYLVKYAIKPLERGRCSWQICELIITSPWQLWQQRRYVVVQNESKSYPDFTRLYDSNITTIEQWIYYLGVRPQPKRGLGQDFHQLREFREGDTLKQIDWNATARQRVPIAKEYQDERDQHIIFLLDCGQRMRIKEHHLSHFDHALNACLLLSHIAIRQGDAVGLATFANDKPIFIKPAKGQQQLNTLINNVYDTQCTKQPADYSQAIQTLLSKTKRRALVILVTNLRYKEPIETVKAIKHLSKYHKVLIASLREDMRDQITHQPIQQFADALTYCGNIHQLLSRGQLQDQLKSQQLPILDVLPKQLGPQLVNHYLMLKRSGSL